MDTLYEEYFPNDLTKQVTRDGRDPVASGGFADIYQGVLQDNGQSTKVAIKAIKTYSGEDNKMYKKHKRLRREIKVWLNLKHDNVLPFLGTTMGFGRFPAMVCPWVENGTLTLYLDNRYDSLSVIGILSLLNNVASGLQYLHSCSVVHGDLSGSNVLIYESGRACIADFGLSMLLTELGASTFATSFHTRGTLRWAAPELLGLEIPVDDMHRGSPRVIPVTQSDVYSFASVMLQILSGKVPYYYYMREMQVMHAVSRGITPARPSSSLVTERRWMFIQQCWSVDTRLRPSGEEIVEFIEQELADCQSREIVMPVAPQPCTTIPTVAPPHPPPDNPTSNAAQPTSSLAALDRPVAPSVLSRMSSEPPYEVSPSHTYSLEWTEYTVKQLLSEVHSTPPDLTPHIVGADDQYVARGDFGDVYRCWYHDGSPKEVAVKVLRFTFTTDRDPVEGFTEMRRELGIWRRVDHINIVPFLGIAYGFGMRGAMSLVSLWMPNGSLHHFLERHHDILDLGHRLQFLLDIANGLHYLHSFPIVHGNLNCNNVLLDADYTARLFDFGHASLEGNIPEALVYLQGSSARPGALRWIAPEQLEPDDTFCRTPKSDIWSFGCMFLQGSWMDAKSWPSLIPLQVLSGKEPWSEVRENAAIIFRLAKGHKPGRPVSPTLDDSHWNFIQDCWSAIKERPTTQVVITTIHQFLNRSLESRPLSYLINKWSSQADSSVDTLTSSLSNVTVDPRKSVNVNDEDDEERHKIRARRPSWHDGLPPNPFLATQSTPHARSRSFDGGSRPWEPAPPWAGTSSSFQIHPLLNGLAPDVDLYFDLALPTFSPLLRSTMISPDKLHEPATYPSVTRMRITHDAIREWPIDLEFQDDGNIAPAVQPPITLGDVLYMIHSSLHRQITHQDWARLSKTKQTEIADAYTRRCQSVPSSAQVEASRGVKRIDYLLDKHVFRVLIRTHNEDGFYHWKLVTGTPRSRR